ncbi:MAG: triose-phosphate isomerase [Alphaproteobacteria bacterium]|nr:triose-phosphate isomerase [Alphaproteobacteria bacterium]
MKTYIIGNWKMHGVRTSARALASTVLDAAGRLASQKTEVILCPPATLLSLIADLTYNTPVRCGGQDCHAEAEGAYTGEISAAMLRDAGATYVIVGHSERRAGHSESSREVNRKAEAALAAGLRPVLCVGESLAERKAGRAMDTVRRQLRESMPRQGDTKRVIVAYEPVWAIGTGQVANASDIAEMHAHIATLLKSEFGFAETEVAVLYGGSVKPANAAEILRCPGVHGVLVGSASLNAEEFVAIINAAQS